MKKRRGILAVLLAMSMAFAMIGCSTQPTDSGSSDASADAEKTSDASTKTTDSTNEKGTILFSTKTITNNEFQRIMVEECQKAVESAGYTFELVLAGDELTVSKQVENIENAINKGVSGIIVAPMDSGALIPALEKAKSAGIPVITADAAIDAGHEDLYITHVGSDNVAIGYEAGQQMIKALDGKGKVCLVRGVAGAMGSEQRSEGFEKAIAECDGIEIVNEQAGNWLSDVAMQVTENMLTADKDMNGIFLCSDAMLSGVISGVQNVGLNPSDLCIISVDGNKSALDSIIAGECYGCVAQIPSFTGKTTGEIMVSILNGEKTADDYEKFIDAGYFFMDKTNTEEAAKYAY